MAASLVCRKCGYDLRGLPVEGVCPECSMEVQSSIHRALELKHAEELRRSPLPSWLRIARSAFLGAAGTLIAAPWVLPPIREYFGYSVILGRRASFNDAMFFCCVPMALFGIGVGVQLANHRKWTSRVAMFLAILLLMWGLMGLGH